ncbi:hypothetical protein JYG23_08745 [Sedimentibacter sp. zth1]|uniref:class II glutamine amidotransferase n=1 Tax=Sedimentibacter sp. zth1 TaxID=2816908 RepID=UPI001A92405F|nr:hypothetical protein [Sedimentibacter sp. zth1]QSX04794.1 hypothetical protein JYG23_08745 [Sedimentibacter sp. zth1]
MCSLFGILNYTKNLNKEQKNIILKVLANECEVRGTDATGISYNFNNRLTVFKRPLPSHKIKFNVPQGANTIMGHTRLTTQGLEKYNYNNHPFVGNCNNTKYSLAHNGIIYNDEQLRRQFKLKNTHIQTDTYIAVQLIDNHKSLDFKSIADSVEQLEGYFTFTILDNEGNLYIIKGESPLALYHFKEYGFYIYASTEEILTKTLKRLGLNKLKYNKIELFQGDILKIDTKGKKEMSQYTPNETLSFPSCPYKYYDDYDNNNTSDSDSIECSYYKLIIEYARSLGFTKKNIDLLMDTGFEVEDIEELLNDPNELSMYIDCYYCK